MSSLKALLKIDLTFLVRIFTPHRFLAIILSWKVIDSIQFHFWERPSLNSFPSWWACTAGITFKGRPSSFSSIHCFANFDQLFCELKKEIQ
ncbi:hypothetical protein PR048_013238 [Dryococelus australis]|uniref:Uncharacterized protein n=1 Tax=Dryococelus australis TaxID=614101 RepID=A0ABQ9HRM1_9NEOP|nr:hypothetical protein PR048_013238 [Dryococelus australis]